MTQDEDEAETEESTHRDGAELRPWKLGRGLYVGGNAAKSFVGSVGGGEDRLKKLNPRTEIPKDAAQALEWVRDGLQEARKRSSKPNTDQ